MMRPEAGAVPKAATAVNGGETTVYEAADPQGAVKGVLENDFGMKMKKYVVIN